MKVVLRLSTIYVLTYAFLDHVQTALADRYSAKCCCARRRILTLGEFDYFGLALFAEKVT